MKQLSLEKISSTPKLTSGGILRNRRWGRQQRPLSTKHPLHLVFKARKEIVCGGLRTSRRFLLIQKLLIHYARHFHIKVEKFSIQNDHIHLLIRTSRRSQYQNFFRVLAGQIAQQFAKNQLLTTPVTDTPKVGNGVKHKLWLLRPFSRVVKGWKNFRTCLEYIQLNEHEVLRVIRYQCKRLRGLTKLERAMVRSRLAYEEAWVSFYVPASTKRE